MSATQSAIRIQSAHQSSSETSRSPGRRGFRPTLAALVALVLLASPCLLAQEDDSEAPSVPPMPEIEFDADEHTEDYRKAVGLLDKGSYKEAKSLFRRLKGKAKTPAQEAAVARGTLKADGGVDFDKANDYYTDEKVRKAIAYLKKKLPKYPETLAGAEMAKLLEEAEASLFHIVENFEEKAASASSDDESESEPGENEGRGGGGGNRGLGTSGFGQNSTVVKLDKVSDNVRQGERGLSWRTGKNLSYLSFDGVKEIAGDYRYLNLSIRTEDPKARPNLVLLMDTMEGMGGGGGRRGAGRRGAAWVYQREGFHTTVTPTGKWQDLRLDLKKFTVKGKISLDHVIALRIVHMPGVAATVYIDNIRLEKE